MDGTVVPMFEKEGVQAAVDFVKYLLTLAGGAIALLIKPSFLADVITSKSNIYINIHLNC